MVLLHIRWALVVHFFTIQTEIVYRFFFYLWFSLSSFYTSYCLYLCFCVQVLRQLDTVVLHAKSFFDLPNACRAEFLLDFVYKCGGMDFVCSRWCFTYVLPIFLQWHEFCGCVLAAYVGRFNAKKVLFFLNISKCIGSE